MLSQLLAPLTTHTALVMAPTWDLHCGLSRTILPVGELKCELGLWDLLLCPMSSVQAKQACSKECRGCPTVEATRSLGVSVLHQRRCTSLQLSPSSAGWDEYFPLLSCQTKARALGSHYHRMYLINFSFTFHLFSPRTCHLNHAADRTFALLSL